MFCNLILVCSTTGKRKACKDCTCGLAEELSGKTVQKDTVKSSCGNVSNITFLKFFSCIVLEILKEKYFSVLSW